MKKRWKTPDVDENNVKSLIDSLQLDPILCQLLIQRDITTKEAAQSFFNPKLENLHDPMQMKDMPEAVARLKTAVEQDQKILLYGDYDVDGTTSVALMYDFLISFHNELDYYIPDRYTEGYGVSEQGIDYAIAQNVDLIIAMDCGIKAIEKVSRAKANGIDFIICDHHLPEKELPAAVAVLDPKRADCPYPYKELSGCGVAFKLVQAFCQDNGLGLKDYQDLLDLVVVSIACDIVPVTGENRILAHFGLKFLNRQPRLGLKALIRQSSKTPPMTISDVVFGIGPMINAAGRLADAKEAVRLLLSTDSIVASEYASKLDYRNNTRKAYDRTMLEEATALVENDPAEQAKSSCVLFKSDWHKGVIGIVAARLVEQYNKPTIVLTQADGKVVASARSIRGFDIHEAIKSCSDLLVNFGGHKYAAGLTMLPENLAAFKERFEAYTIAQLEKIDTTPEIEISGELELSNITKGFWKSLQQFAPFGPKNRNPVFSSMKVKDSGFSKLVKEKHLKLSVRQNDSEIFNGIAFDRLADFHEMQNHDDFNLAYNIVENTWKNKTTLQLNVKDISYG